MSGSLLDSDVGTAWYKAPELHVKSSANTNKRTHATLEGQPVKRVVQPYRGPPVDVWALGLSALVMLRGECAALRPFSRAAVSAAS